MSSLNDQSFPLTFLHTSDIQLNVAQNICNLLWSKGHLPQKKTNRSYTIWSLFKKCDSHNWGERTPEKYWDSGDTSDNNWSNSFMSKTSNMRLLKSNFAWGSARHIQLSLGVMQYWESLMHERYVSYLWIVRLLLFYFVVTSGCLELNFWLWVQGPVLAMLGGPYGVPDQIHQILGFIFHHLTLTCWVLHMKWTLSEYIQNKSTFVSFCCCCCSIMCYYFK